jgi:hypothetical protein
MRLTPAAKGLGRLLRGSGAEAAVPQLLAARDAYLAAPGGAQEDLPVATLAEGPADPAKQAGPRPEFVCAISHELMTDPVSTSTGQTYERAAIARWLASHNTDPVATEGPVA